VRLEGKFVLITFTNQFKGHPKTMRSPRHEDKSALGQLDPVLILKVLSFCEDKDLARVLAVSKFWRGFAADKQLWAELAARAFVGDEAKLPTKFDEDNQGEDLEAGMLSTTKTKRGVKQYPWVKGYAKKTVEKRDQKKRNEEKQKIINSLQGKSGRLCCLKTITSSGWTPFYWMPLLLFSVTIAVKLDFPERYNWYAAFSPLWIFSIWMIIPIVAYWIITLSCPILYVYQPAYRYPRWRTRFNFIWTSMEWVKRDTKHALVWRFFNSLCLLLFPVFTFLLPAGLEKGDNALIDSSFAFLMLAGCYGMFVMRIVFKEAKTMDNWQDDVGREDNDIILLTLIITMLSFFPALFLTTILWYIQWRFHVLGSFTIALIPMFISNAMFMFACITPYVLRRMFLFQNGGFIDGVEAGFGGLAGFCFISPFFIFEVLLVYHFEKMKYMYVIVFIPLWIVLCIFGSMGCLVTGLMLTDDNWEMRQLPVVEQPQPPPQILMGNPPPNDFNQFDDPFF
jgi:hypothetical protein